MALAAGVLRRPMHVMAGGTGNLSLVRLVRIRLICRGLHCERRISSTVTGQAFGGRGWLHASGCVAAGAFQLCGDVPVYQEAMAGAWYRLGVQFRSNTDTDYSKNCRVHEPGYQLTAAARITP